MAVLEGDAAAPGEPLVGGRGPMETQDTGSLPEDATAIAVVRESGPPVSLGVTEPISLGLPTAAELALTEQLQEEMRHDAPLESQEKMTFRACVLMELQRIVRQWIYEVSVQQCMDEASAHSAGAKIFTFGSYRLGLVSPGSDIDALCVAPRHVTRESFFQVLVTKLREHPDVAELAPVPDAYVPIIKMKFSDISIDLLFARLGLSEIPENLESLNDNNLLKNMDDRTVRSLNGCRVADHILSLVPDVDRFRDTLRLIKIWAKRRGIYSNVLGFYGGITWSILVARVCQLFPHYCAAALVRRFFRVFARWNWRVPVVLCPIQPRSQVPGLIAHVPWNPKENPQDRQHLMPIITPAFPSMNSTHNVSETTRRIILEELARGQEVTAKVEEGKCPWSEVYKPLPFFTQHRHYLLVEVLGKSQQVFTKWSGWIESKLRFLVRSLEQIPYVQVRPWPNHMDFKDPEWPFATAMFIGLTIATRNGQRWHTVNLRDQVVQFVEKINSWNERSQSASLSDMRVRHVQRRDLPDYVPKDGLKTRRTSSQAFSEDYGETGEQGDPAFKRLRAEADDAVMSEKPPATATEAAEPAAAPVATMVPGTSPGDATSTAVMSDDQSVVRRQTSLEATDTAPSSPAVGSGAFPEPTTPAAMALPAVSAPAAVPAVVSAEPPAEPLAPLPVQPLAPVPFQPAAAPSAEAPVPAPPHGWVPLMVPPSSPPPSSPPPSRHVVHAIPTGPLGGTGAHVAAPLTVPISAGASDPVSPTLAPPPARRKAGKITVKLAE